MNTVVVQIGNSDDKLSQKQWSMFSREIVAAIKNYSQIMHFGGASDSFEQWQNACFVIDCTDEDIPYLRQSLTTVRKRYNQDSVAIMTGETEFI